MGLVERIARIAAGWLLAAALGVAPLVQALTHGPAASGGASWGVDAAAQGDASAVLVAEDGDRVPPDASDHEHPTFALLPAAAGLSPRPAARMRRGRGGPAGASARDGPRRPPRRPSA